MTEHVATANGKLRESAIWFGWLICVVLAAFALDQLARSQLREHLRGSATAMLGALTHGDTPWRWSMRSAADVIAGRAFGSSDAQFAEHGFRVVSQGEAFEFGLVLAGTLDLQRFRRIEGNARVEQATPMSVILRTRFDQPLCRSTTFTIRPETPGFSIDLLESAWRCADGSSLVPMSAAMLRLSFDLDEGQSVVVSDVRFPPHAAPSLESLATLGAFQMPSASDRAALVLAIQATQISASGAAWPVFELKSDARVEQDLVARDLIHEQSPAALVIASGDLDTVRAAAAQWSATSRDFAPPWLSWAALALYAALLAMLRFKPVRSPKLRALCELLGAIALPLVLVIGGLISDNLGLPIQLAIAASLLFALSLLVGTAPASPTTRTARRGSLLALLSVIIAIAVVLILRNGSPLDEFPDSRKIAQYLAWAAVQQFLVCVIVADRLERLLGSARWALLCTAIIFALLHTPNATLMQFTFIGGLIWIWNWQRHRALLPNILAHTACGLLVASQLPIDWLRSIEVSARYFL